MLDLANILFTIIYSITVPDSCQSCPTYEELDMMYKDNTHPGVSGEIIDNIRIAPGIHKEWLWYEQQGYEYVIYYDPPPKIVERSLHITIQPSLPAYKMGPVSNSLNMSENTVMFGEGRWVGNNCGSASISAKLWVSLLGDTMNYMKERCDANATIFNSNVTYNFANDEENQNETFQWDLASDKEKTVNANTGGKLIKENNISQWQYDIQKYVEAWINSIFSPYESDLSDKEWNEELEKIKN